MQLICATLCKFKVYSSPPRYLPLTYGSGGLGLTAGIVDVGGLYDCLIGIYEGKADQSILDKYSNIRRQKYLEIVDPISSENLRRLFGQDPNKALENDEFLQLCKSTETDPKFSRSLQMVCSYGTILSHSH
jgi:hypothetical protein